MLCPTCDNTQLTMSDRQGIEIDYCPKCRGIWLDRGELDKIIERASAETRGADSQRSPEPRRDRDHGYGDGHDSRKYASGHRKKNFWQEIFD